MDGLEDLSRLLAVERQERRRNRVLESLGYFDPADDDFGLNKWTQLLYFDRSSEEDERRGFHEHNPIRLVSVLAVPNDLSGLELDVASQAFLEWVSALRWDYCPGSESPFPHAQPQACSEGILLPAWLNREWRTVLERFLVIRRNGIAELGLGTEVYYRQSEEIVFRFIPIVARIWQFLGFYAELHARFFEADLGGVTYWVNIRGTRNALLGNLAEGWRSPHSHDPGWRYNPRCPDKHLQFSKVVDEISPDVDSLVRWFATRIDNAWGQFEPRCYVRAGLDESQPFAHRNMKR